VQLSVPDDELAPDDRAELREVDRPELCRTAPQVSTHGLPSTDTVSARGYKMNVESAGPRDPAWVGNEGVKR